MEEESSLNSALNPYVSFDIWPSSVGRLDENLFDARTKSSNKSDMLPSSVGMAWLIQFDDTSNCDKRETIWPWMGSGGGGVSRYSGEEWEEGRDQYDHRTQSTEGEVTTASPTRWPPAGLPFAKGLKRRARCRRA